VRSLVFTFFFGLFPRNPLIVFFFGFFVFLTFGRSPFLFTFASLFPVLPSDLSRHLLLLIFCYPVPPEAIFSRPPSSVLCVFSLSFFSPCTLLPFYIGLCLVCLSAFVPSSLLPGLYVLFRPFLLSPIGRLSSLRFLITPMPFPFLALLPSGRGRPLFPPGLIYVFPPFGILLLFLHGRP